jgi:hypothetical protein
MTNLLRSAIFIFFIIGTTLQSITHADAIIFADQKINVRYESTLTEPPREQAYLWLQRVAGALLTVYHRLPKDQFEIQVRRNTSGDSPVPWGQISRGNPTIAALFINPAFSLEEIARDWTAYHELSHLFIPYRGYGNLWFSEGLATYYQNIVQARRGLLNEYQFWKKMNDGFKRGYNQNTWPNHSLKVISESMGKYRAFMRVHWSGVHYWMRSDLKLRKLSQNKKSLDTVLLQLKECCESKSLSAIAIARQLDQLAGVDFFARDFEKYKNSLSMPAYQQMLSELGIIDGESHLEFDDEAMNAELRKSIYHGDS